MVGLTNDCSFCIMSENINNENIAKGTPQPMKKKKKSMVGQPFWVDAMVVVLLFVIAQALATVACLALGLRMPGIAMTTSFDAEVLENADSMQARFIAITYLLSMVIFYISMFIYQRMRGWSSKGWFNMRGCTPVRLLAGYLLIWCISVVVEPLSEALPGNQDMLGNGGWLLFSSVLLAPIFEESLFRGYMAGILRKAYGGMTAWIVPAVTFGVIHAIPSVVFSAILMGLVLGYLYLRYRSLGLVVMLHAMNNLTACFLRMMDMGDMTVSGLFSEGPWYWALYAVCAVVLGVSLVKMYRYVSGIKVENNTSIE